MKEENDELLTVGIRLRESTWAKIKALADADHRTANSYLVKLIYDHLDNMASEATETPMVANSE